MCLNHAVACGIYNFLRILDFTKRRWDIEEISRDILETETNIKNHCILGFLATSVH